MDPKNRMEELEIKVAFQEHCLSQLDEVIQTLRVEVDMLKAETSSLKQELGSLQPSPEDAPPPHW